MTYLTTREVAEKLRRSPRTVEDWRQLGTGPRFVRINRSVLYPAVEVERFERDRELHRSTA